MTTTIMLILKSDKTIQHIMKSNQWYALAFAGMCVLYLAIPVLMIRQQEGILKEGTVFRFALQPIDPPDAFRGRYLELNFNMPAFPPPGELVEYNQKVFLTVTKDSAGMGQFEALHADPPHDTPDYVAARVAGTSSHEVHCFVPDEMRRFYLNEDLAPLADKWYAELLNRDDRREVPVTVDLRVLKGKALIEQVYFEGVPVAEYIRGKEKEE